MSIPLASGSSLPSGGSPAVNPMLTLKGTPPGAQASEPAWVRNGSTTTQKAYQTALAFEQMLVEQLSQSLTASSGLSGEEGESSEGGPSGSSAAAGPLSSMLPQALTSSVMNDGGLGLAAQMTRQLQDAVGATRADTSGNPGALASGGTSLSATAPASSGPGAAGNVATTGGTSS